MAERVAVVVTKGAFGSGANVCEDEMGGGLGGNPLEVDTVPRRRSRREDARFGTKLGFSVVANSKAITWRLVSKEVKQMKVQTNRCEVFSCPNGDGNRTIV